MTTLVVPADSFAEFILLSDTLGVSALVQAINNSKPPGATEGTVLGPFFAEDAHDCKILPTLLKDVHPLSSLPISASTISARLMIQSTHLITPPTVENGDSIASEGRGHYMYVSGRILNTRGAGIAGAVIDTWESDGEGRYDAQVRFSFVLGSSRLRCYG